MTDKPKAMIGNIDVTDMVASMYDNLINSMDWGSEFLCQEDIVNIVAVGKLLGFEVPDGNIEGIVPSDLRFPAPRYPVRNKQETDDAWKVRCNVWSAEYKAHKAAAIARWRAQIDAAVAAKLSAKEDE